MAKQSAYRPLLSVVTVVKNGVDLLPRCIASVSQQQDVRIEHCIADGGSSDGTLEVIKQHTGELAWWDSREDEGIADAMNRALAHVRGEWVMFLGADDYLPDTKTLARALPYLSNGNYDLCWFDIWFEGENQSRLRGRPRRLNAWTRFKMPGCHQGLLSRRQLFEKYGGFDVQLKVVMDYDWVLRLYRQGVRAGYVPEILAVMSNSGISSRRGWGDVRKRLHEEARVHRRQASGVMHLVYACWHPLYLGYRWLRKR